MADNPTVNRCIKDKHFDRIDHALGRPTFPLEETYRNFFAVGDGSTIALSFDRSPHWQINGARNGMAYDSVTRAGRQALAEWLTEHGKAWRPYAVTWEGSTRTVAAGSTGKAKYQCFIEISDSFCDLTFKAFLETASARRLPEVRHV